MAVVVGIGVGIMYGFGGSVGIPHGVEVGLGVGLGVGVGGSPPHAVTIASTNTLTTILMDSSSIGVGAPVIQA